MTEARLILGRVVALAVALLIFVSDRLTKVMIQHALNSFDDTPVIPGLLRLTHVENPGAAFGFFSEGNPILRSVILHGVTFAVICFVAVALWQRRGAYTAFRSRFALGLILGGAVGNFLDRVTRGTVTDFIEVYHGSWTFPAFNIADSAITIGGALLVMEMIWPHSSSPGRTTSTNAPQAH